MLKPEIKFNPRGICKILVKKIIEKKALINGFTIEHLKTEHFGNAFVASQNGHILTANHCLKKKPRLITELIFNKNLSFTDETADSQKKLKVIKTWPDYDIALLRADHKFPKSWVIPFARGRNESILGPYWIVGNFYFSERDSKKLYIPIIYLVSMIKKPALIGFLPLSLKQTNSLRQKISPDKKRLLQGLSGSPIINDKGKLIGIFTKSMPNIDKDDSYKDRINYIKEIIIKKSPYYGWQSAQNFEALFSPDWHEFKELKLEIKELIAKNA